MDIPQQRIDSSFVKVVMLLVRIAPQLAYTPANCSRQAAQAKPEGLLRLPRANQQHKKDSTIDDAVIIIRHVPQISTMMLFCWIYLNFQAN